MAKKKSTGKRASASKTKGAAPTSNSGFGSAAPFLDAFEKTPAPSPIALVRECLGTAYSCATLNSDLVASTTLRLYVRTTRRARKSALMSRGDTRPLNKRQRERLGKMPGLVGKLANQATDVHEVLSHPALDLLDRPNDTSEDGVGMDRYSLLEITQRYMEIVGRCYWYIEPGGMGGTPSSIWLLAPQMTQEVTQIGGKRLIDHYQYSGGMGQTYQPDEITPFRFPDLHTGGYTGGFSPLRAAFEQVRIFRLYAAWTNALLKNSGRPSQAWTPKGDESGSPIGEAEAKRVRSAFRQAFSMAGLGGILVTDYPGTLTPLTWNSEEIIPPETAKEMKIQVANCFAVPETKLNRNDATLAGAQTGDYAHAKDAGLPRLHRMEAALNAFYLTKWEDPDRQLFFAFDEPEGLRDEQAERTAWNTGVSNGVILRNEARAELGLEAMPWGDQPLAPSTMIAVDETGKPIPPTPNPAFGSLVIGGDGKGTPKDTPQDDTPPATDDQAAAVASNDLRATVGGSAQVLALQEAYYSGGLPREAAIANAQLIFGFSEDEAGQLFPETAPDAPKREVEDEPTPAGQVDAKPTEPEPPVAGEDKVKSADAKDRDQTRSDTSDDSNRPLDARDPEASGSESKGSTAAGSKDSAGHGSNDDAVASKTSEADGQTIYTAPNEVESVYEPDDSDSEVATDQSDSTSSAAGSSGTDGTSPDGMADDGVYQSRSARDGTAGSAGDADDSRPSKGQKAARQIARVGADGKAGVLPQGEQLAAVIRNCFASQRNELIAKLSAANMAKAEGDEQPPSKLPADFIPAEKWAGEIARAAKPIIEMQLRESAQEFTAQLGAPANVFNVVNANIPDAAAKLTLKFSQETVATTSQQIDQALTQLRSDIAEGVVQGDTRAEMIARVQKVFDQAEESRAATIAQTETSRAVHQADLMSAKQSGVVSKKYWIASADACQDKCEPLAEMGEIPLDQSFDVDDYGPIDAPPAHPRCQCSIGYVTDADDEDEGE